MDVIGIVEVMVYLACFVVSMYAFSSVKFDLICHVRNPLKVQLLWLLLSTGLAYVVAQFILGLTIYM